MLHVDLPIDTQVRS